LRYSEFWSRILIAITLVTCLSVPTTVPAQSYTSPDPNAAARLPLPAHDPAAQLRGKTALEHAEDLAEPVMMRRLMALEALIDMGTDALPARDMVRFVIERDQAGAFSDAQIGELKLSALSAMYAMQAPETKALLRSAIIDPDFVSRDRFYVGLLNGVKQVGIDTDILTRDLTVLVDTAPDHAIRLMRLNELPDPVQVALEQAVFEAPHGEGATRHFLRHLVELPFLDDESRIAYVLDNPQSAGLALDVSVDALAAVGTEAALDAALAIGPSEGVPHARSGPRNRDAAAGASGEVPRGEPADRSGRRDHRKDAWG